MAKATIEFNIPEEQDIFSYAVHAEDLYVVISNMMEYLRRKYKHEGPTEEVRGVELEEIRDKLWQEVQDNGLSSLF